MERIQQNVNIHDVLDYGHSFDPDGTLTGNKAVRSPRVWVPDRDWFDDKLHSVTLADVFTIFPEAETEILSLIIGRVGVGRSNHKPPGFTEPVDHTARMAAVVVGKDAGLGKSTLFNGMTAAFSRCGFLTHTFKSTEDRFRSESSSDGRYRIQRRHCDEVAQVVPVCGRNKDPDYQWLIPDGREVPECGTDMAEVRHARQLK